MLTLFDKQVKLRMGQANVQNWIDDVMPLVTGDSDPLGVEGFATHKLPQILETGEVLSPDKSPTTKDTPGGKLLGMVTGRTREEGLI